jgi:two-component system cell cycle sensor histidine kinase/response regulator CckA
MCATRVTRQRGQSSRSAVILVLAALLLSGSAWADPGPNRTPKRVLILYSFDNEEGIYTGFDRVLRSELRSKVPDRVELYTEYLDLVRFPASGHAKDLAKLLKLKFSDHKPDLVVPVSYAAVKFLLGEGKELFPGTPIVALFNVRRLEDLKQAMGKGSGGPSLTGVASTDEPARTLDLALRLQPDTERVAVIVGASSGEQFWQEELKSDFAPYQQKVAITYLTALPMDSLVKQVSGLPPHTVLLSTYFFEDGNGQFFAPEEALDLITHSASVPVYGIYSTYIGHGVTGGHMTDPEKLGRLVGGLAVRVLRGENPSSIPFVVDNSAQDTVDWRQLQRWHLSETNLPAGSVELFREPSGWERYRGYILATVALCFFEAMLIASMIFSERKRRRAEKALLREKTLSDAVIGVIPGLFFLQDETGKNIRWNKNAEMLVRDAPSEAAPLRNVAEEYRHIAEQAQQEIFTTGFAEGELEMLAKDGQRIPYYFSGVRVELNGKPYVAVVGVDITRPRLAEQALRVSEAELRSFVEHAPYGIGRTSVNEDRFLNANPALVKMLGYRSEAEMLGMRISRDLSSEADSRGFRAQPTRADYFSGVEFAWRRKDGRPISVRASGRRLSGEPGDIIEIIVEDVSARRVLEEQLRQAQKMEALGQLAGSVAHDFNNLLAVIIGYSELLSAAAGADGISRSRVEIIRNAGERAASLTAQLLAFSRRSVMQPKVVNLNSLVMETTKMLQRLMGEDVEHRLVLDPNLGRTRADPGQMVQVIMNLAVNARDAMPRGGRLTIATAPVVLGEDAVIQDVSLPAGPYVMLSVSDTGIGMDSETRARLFEPFFTTKPVGKGTGLGLATVYGIVKQCGGFIFAETKPGVGTTFRVYLPQVEQAAEAPAARTSQAVAGQSLGTILLVEDEVAFRDLLREGLHAIGYSVLVGENGVDALQVAEQHQGPISLLVTDVIMPQMSGPELAGRLKEVRPEIQVLYMSGYTDDKLGDLSHPDNDLALMQKPFYISELAAKLRELLKRRPAQPAGTHQKTGAGNLVGD